MPTADEAAADGTRSEAAIAARIAAARAPRDPEAERLRAATLAAVVGTPAAPVRIGRFEIEGVLGRGGAGVVYRARDPRLERTIALKLVPGGGAAALEEARALARVAHPHVVAVYDAEPVDDGVAIALERVAGATLRRWLAAAPRSRAAVLAALAAAADGLAAIHRAGLVHGDVKPDNILVGDDGRVRIGDFGLARLAGERSRGGTPGYLAPEQLDGEATPAADVLALALTAIEALGGERPLAALDADALRAAHDRLRAALRRPWPARSLRGVRGRRLRRALSAALAPAAERATLPALRAALERALGAPRRRRVSIAVGLLALGGGGGLAWALTAPSPAEVCQAAAAPIAAPLDPALAARVSARLNAGVAGRGGAATAARVAAAFERHAAARRLAVADVCAGPAPPRAAALACLDGSRRRAAAFAARLAEADAALAERSIGAALDATSIEDCAADRLGRPAAPAGDAAIAAALAGSLALGEAAADAQRLAEARAVAAAVALGAGSIEDFGLVARARMLEGMSAHNLDDDAGAVAAYRAAAAAAERGGDDRLAALAWTRLGSAARARNALGESRAHFEQAAAKLARLGEPAAPAAFLARNRALLEEADGHPAAALALAERAAAAYQELDPRRGRVADSWATVSRLRQAVGDQTGARAAAEHALAIASDVFGPHHPRTADARLELAVSDTRLGRLDVALRGYDEVVAVRRASPGAHSVLAAALGDRAQALEAIGRHDDAVADLREAVALREAAFGPDDPRVATPLTNLGYALSPHAPREAIGHLERARRLRAAALGDGHLEVIGIDHALGRALLGAGDHRAAIARFTDVEARYRRALGGESPKVAMALCSIGQALLDAGRARDALEPLGRAARLRAGPTASMPVDRALCSFLLARAEHASGAGTRALATAATAEAALAGVPGTSAAALRDRIAGWRVRPDDGDRRPSRRPP